MKVEEKLSARGRAMQPSAIRRMTRLSASAGPDLISFAGGMPNRATFPLEQLAEIASIEILEHSGRNLQYGATTGYGPLIKWISEYLQSRKLEAPADQIVCTTGSQQAIDLITEILIDPEDFILVEVPTYLGALSVFAKSRAQVLPVPQDKDGLVVQALRERLNKLPKERRKLIYIISNFQNPSGISLAAKRRSEIAALLDEFDAYLIEDDPYGELYADEANKPPDPVWHWNPDRVFYLGTFSKLIAPTFRTGWVVAPAGFAPKLELAKEAADLCSSLLDQRIVFRFAFAPNFSSHVAGLRTFYATRCKAMLQSLAASMPDGITWTEPGGGFFIWMKLPEHLDAESFLEETVTVERVSFIVGRPFTCDGSAKNFLRLAFSNEDPPRIDEGIKRLAKVIRSRL